MTERMIYSYGGTEFELDISLIKESEEEAVKQLREYFRRNRRDFKLELETSEGFTGEVINEILAIPYGKTKSYTEIASNIGTAPIAVGQACGRNPLPVIVPCHRLTGKNNLGGYKYSKEAKRSLLSLEKDFGDV